LKGKMLLHFSNTANPHQLSLRAGVTAPTVNKFVTRPEEVALLDTDALITILVKGCGLTMEQIRRMQIGDLFEIGIYDKPVPRQAAREPRPDPNPGGTPRRFIR
jgi:hypothetical protein